MRKTLLTLAAGLLCLSASAAESAPYSYTFDNADCLNTNISGWSISAPKATATHRFRYADKSGGAPLYGGNAISCVVSRNITSASEYSTKDVWLISPAIQLEGGKTYNVTYKYAMSSQEMCNVSIYCAKASDVETLRATDALFDGSTAVGTGYTKEEDFNNLLTCTVTPAETGEYYIGIWDNTAREANGYLCIAEFSVAPAAAGTAPGVPTDFSVVADPNGALNVAIEVSAPVNDASGNPLSGKVTLELLRGETLIKSWPDLDPGSIVMFTDYNATNGMNLYSVRAVNSDGTSNVVSQQVKVGMEIPNALKSFTAIQTTPGYVKFVWEKPDSDIKGTIIQDKSLVKVKIEAYDDTDALVKTFENIEGDNTTLQVVEAAGDQKFYTFRAYAVTTAGESVMIETKGVAIGTPSTLPYCEDFKGGVATQPLYMSNYETFRAYWDIYTVTDMVTFEDKNIARFTTGGHGSIASIYSGLINIPADAEAEWTLEYAASSGTATGHTLILLINDGEGWAEVNTYDINSSAYNQAKVDLSSYAGGTIQYGIRVKGSSYGGVNIANINIKNTKETPSGIESIVTDEQEGEAIYYDLMGRRIANPTTGVIYIKVVNGKATRVLYR